MSASRPSRVEVLLITGPAGVGKSTLSWEVGARLATAGIAHAAVEGDELDRVFPPPTPAELGRLRPGTTDVSLLNLAAIWATYRALGHTRLIMTGVVHDPAAARAWIVAAIPGAAITIVRLRSSVATLLGRLDRREVGSGRADQVRRSLEQAALMADEATEGLVVVPTDDATPAELADRVLRAAGWPGSGDGPSPQGAWGGAACGG